jgi:ArsR family transcriptional regulator
MHRENSYIPDMSNNLNKELLRFADIFKALSNPHRLRIFLKLTSCCAPGTVCRVEAGGGAYVGQLADDLDIAPSTVSHHIKELRQAGLIRMRRRGQKIECWVDPDAYHELATFFHAGGSPSRSARQHRHLGAAGNASFAEEPCPETP